ncbi:general odorant-binding protein 56h-like [Musca domestica]|uniref:General odorant-binding protein 56h-like n=1 Tax=Musca domestica TaxID=7370 RepID=A0A1I8NC49_MUSDO|nr:general odorant-binding protein 56h-like [Musca domestica]
MIMKYFKILTLMIVYGLVAAIEASGEEEFKNIKAACEQEHPLDSDEVIDFGEDPANNVNDHVKCFLECLFKKQNILKNGIVDVKALIKSLEIYPSFKSRNHQVLQAVDNCHTERGPNDCETAYKLMMCLKNHAADVYGNE